MVVNYYLFDGRFKFAIKEERINLIYFKIILDIPFYLCILVDT